MNNGTYQAAIDFGGGWERKYNAMAEQPNRADLIHDATNVATVYLINVCGRGRLAFTGANNN